MILLRQFDSTIASATLPEVAPHLRDSTASVVLQFGAQPSKNLSNFIASFAHPVHVESVLSSVDSEEILEGVDEVEWRQVDARAPPSPSHSEDPAIGHPSTCQELEHSA